MTKCPVCGEDIYTRGARTCSKSCAALVRSQGGIKAARLAFEDRIGKEWATGNNGKPRLVRTNK